MVSSLVILLCLLLACGSPARAAETNSLVWNKAADRVNADLHGEPLWPLLEDIAHQTGWHIFVEPGSARVASTKFKDLPPDDALRMLLGNLNFAFVPRTNGPDFLYVFTTSRGNATQPVLPEKPVVKKQQHVANELIVKLKPGADIDALAKALGARVVARNDKLHLYELLFSDEVETDTALGELKSNSDVEAVDYNYVFDPPVTPQPLANVPAGMGLPALTLAPSTQGDACNPVVGLIDTGIQSLGSQLDQFITKQISVVGYAASGASGSTHVQSLVSQVDPLTPKQVSTPNNSSAMPTHGTAMAETILRAVSQAGGASSPVRIVAVDVYGTSETTTSWNVALGIQAAVDNGATVLNLSLGGASDSAVLDSIIQQALAQGVVIFAAAGNQPVNTPTYPAAISGVNAVTALGAPGQLAAYANFGSFVGMALPGASVVYLGNQAYVVQGTSPATAYATGVAAGTKSSGCLPWAQIQASMQQQFPVPKQ